MLPGGVQIILCIYSRIIHILAEFFQKFSEILNIFSF